MSRRLGVAAIDVGYAEHVSHEDTVEQSALRCFCVVDPIVERVVIDRGIARMRPQAGPIWLGAVMLKALNRSSRGLVMNLIRSSFAEHMRSA